MICPLVCLTSRAGDFYRRKKEEEKKRKQIDIKGQKVSILRKWLDSDMFHSSWTLQGWGRDTKSLLVSSGEGRGRGHRTTSFLGYTFDNALQYGPEVLIYLGPYFYASQLSVGTIYTIKLRATRGEKITLFFVTGLT